MQWRIEKLPRLLSIAAMIALLATLPGCSSDDRPELVAVQGLITLDGQPLPNAYVIFQPEDGGRGSRAVTRTDGRYELVYLRDIVGVRPGKHSIYISTAVEGQPIDRVPKKYNKESTLTAVVPDDGGEIDFALESK